MRGPSGRWATAWAIGLVALMAIPGGAGLGATPAALAPRAVPAAAPSPAVAVRGLASTLHDLLVTTPQLGGLQGVPLNFSASLAGVAGLPSAVNWTWGDGTVATDAASLLPHTYANPGLYEVEAQTTTAGTGHDNWADLLAIPVGATHAGDTMGTAPQLTGWVVRNGTTPTGGTAVLPMGGSVTVATQLTEAIAAPALTGAVGSFAVPGALSAVATFSGQTLDPLGVSTTTVTFAPTAPVGLYPVTYNFSATVDVDAASYPIAASFEFTVALGGGAGGGAVPYAQSADPTTLTAYYPASAPIAAPDPGLDWESNGNQLFRNVYQTLILPNGSATGGDANSFLPSIAACVPGSALCTTLFHTPLVNGYNYTFVLRNSSQFYDPATASSWPIYPTDVEFSVVRSLAFAIGTCFQCTNGWMLAQALLPAGNPNWDSGMHAPYNNTPTNIADALSINDSSDCPSGAQTAPYDGCITFRADGGGQSWPFFLQLLADANGGTIVPCGWFSSSNQNAGIPDWTEGNVTGAGDGPCPAPGVGSFGSALTSLSDTAWDSWELDAVLAQQQIVTDAAAGSGPYYVAQWSNYTGYTLAANPAYAPNPDCVGAACEPAANAYIPNVVVDYETSTATGLAALAAGAADWAYAGPADTGTLAADAVAGLGSVVVSPTLSFYANGFDFSYNATNAAAYLGLSPTAPAQLLTDPNLRQFLVTAFPEANVTADDFNANGTAAAFSFGGGVIPLDDGGAAPANVSWPAGNPITNPAVSGSAGWWWARVASDGAAGVNCTKVSPCTFPVGYLAPDPLLAGAEAQWAASVRGISGGRVVPEVVAANITEFAESLFAGPGQNPFAVFATAWLNDYPDASDPVTALYAPGGSYGRPDAFPTLETFTSGSCATSPSYWSTLTTPVSMGCQGAAYQAGLTEFQTAQTAPLGPTRIGDYAAGEQIEQRLALYGAVGQLNTLAGVAPWINGTSLETNPWLASNGQDWYSVRERAGPGAPLAVRGPIAAPAVIPSTAPLNLSASGVGGAGGYTYTWSGLPAGCVGTGARFSCLAKTTGTFTVTVTVHDALSHVATASVTVRITGLVVSSFTIVPSIVAIGQTTRLTTVLANPTGQENYAYAPLPLGCASQNATTLTCTPRQGGVFDVGVIVTAPNGSRGAASATLTVTGGNLSVASFTATPAAVDLGSSTTFQVALLNASNASTSVTFSGVPGCAETDAARNITIGSNPPFFGVSIGCTPTARGTFTANASVTSGSNRTEANTTLAVNSAPSARVGVSAAAIDLGQPLTFTATAVNGSAPLTWSYTGLPSGCVSANTAALTCTPTAQGTSVVTAHLDDGSNNRASASVTVTVNAALSLVQFVAVPNPVSIGGSTNLTVRLGGGTAPLVYNYTGLPASCPTSDTGVLLCLPTTAGAYVVTVTVKDAAGESITARADLNVTGASSPAPAPTLLGLPLAEGLALIVVLAVIVVAAIVLLTRRRRPPPDEEAAAPPDGPGPSA